MKIHHIALFAAGLLLSAPMALAQPAPIPAPRTITVTGDGEVKVAPDHVMLSFTIAVDDKDIDRVRAQVEERTRKLLALVKQQGVEGKDLQSDYLNIAPRYQTGRLVGDNEFLGYFATRRVSVILRDLGKFEALIAEALRQGVTGVDQGEFRTSQLRQHRDQARALASKAALEKAKAIAAELGASVGQPYSIVENTVGYAPLRYQAQNASANAGGNNDGEGLAPGQLSVRAQVTVSFLLQ
jgi:uncharacterized protein YggE